MNLAALTDLIDDRELSFLIGAVAMLFPCIVMVGLWPEVPDAARLCQHLDSLSSYYGCTGFTRNFFVGALTAIGVLLWSYRGFRNEDGSRPWTRIFGPVAGVAAIGVAFFPVLYHKYIHYACAITLFVMLVLLAIQFARHESSRLRWFFAGCALAITASVITAGLLGFVMHRPIRDAETAAVEFFGLAWLLNTRLHQSPLVQKFIARVMNGIASLLGWQKKLPESPPPKEVSEVSATEVSGEPRA